MATTKYKIAEQVKRILLGGNPSRDSELAMQELIIAVEQEFGTAIKNSWFLNKNDGVSEIGGAFIFSFKNVYVLKDTDTDMYYSVMPSSYIDLPNEMGVHQISLMKSQDEPFTRLANGYNAMFNGLMSAGVLAEQQTFFVESDRVCFPNMKEKDNISLVLMKLAVSLNGIDQDTNINLSPEIESQIVSAVVQRYMPELQLPKDKKNDNVK